MRQQVQQLGIGVVKLQHDGRGKAAQDGRNGFGVNVDEGERFAFLCQHDGTGTGHGRLFVRQLQRQILAVNAQQSQGDRNNKRLLDRLTRRWPTALRQCEGVSTGCRVVCAQGLHARRTGLGIPAFELRQQARQV